MTFRSRELLLVVLVLQSGEGEIMTFCSRELLIIVLVLQSGEGEIMTFFSRELLLLVLVLYLEKVQLWLSALGSYCW